MKWRIKRVDLGNGPWWEASHTGGMVAYRRGWSEVAQAIQQTEAFWKRLAVVR